LGAGGQDAKDLGNADGVAQGKKGQGWTRFTFYVIVMVWNGGAGLCGGRWHA
jgi:hypothetical protein